MTTEPHESDLHAYVDDQLDADEMRRVEAWLSARPGERRRVEDYARHKALLRLALTRAAGDEQDGANRFEALQRKLADRIAARPRRTSLMRIAAALLLFSLGAASHAGFQAYQEWRVPQVVTAATQAHQVFVGDPRRPVELPAHARREMVTWFSEHLGTDVEIPNLRPLGLRFVGGRLLASSEGPMAQFLYEDRHGDRLSVYLTAEPTGSGRELQVVQVESVSAGYWQDGELTYTIVADMEVDDLFAIASEMSWRTASARF
jgi:anti-sigma factor RsiW